MPLKTVGVSLPDLRLSNKSRQENPTVNKQKLLLELQRVYVSIMMEVIGLGLVSTSEVDEDVIREVSQFPVGMEFRMIVLPDGPSFRLRVKEGGRLELAGNSPGKPDLDIRFKHLSHAFLVFSFQESTARAFANDRMVADGEVSHAIRLVRCLDKMEALILPKLVAERAVKRYPASLSLNEKINKAARIYALVAKHFLTRS